MDINNKSILDKAIEITYSRLKSYGDPVENLSDIANLWNAYIKSRKIDTIDNNGELLSNKDVSMMMILLKISRETNNTKEDNLIDIAGYCRLASVIEKFEVI